MERPAFDPHRAEAFAEEMLGVLNGGALALMLSLGHRAGLFDVMTRLEPASSETLAREAGLHERYVREWLGAMVTGGVVEHDAATGTFRLPPEHAVVLTRTARPYNVAVSAQWIPLLGALEDRVLGCFEQGGGVPADAYRRFHAVMTEQSEQSVVARLVEAIVPLVPGLADALAGGSDVLDVGCGTGRALLRLARAFPKSRFRGIDLAPEAIACARTGLRDAHLRNVEFAVRDAADLQESAAYDVVTAFQTLHVQARPQAALAAIARALRPGGVLLMQQARGSGRLDSDVDHPLAPFLYTVSCMRDMPVSLGQSGAGLGVMWGRSEAERMLREAGFATIRVHELTDDPVLAYTVARTPA